MNSAYLAYSSCPAFPDIFLSCPAYSSYQSQPSSVCFVTKDDIWNTLWPFVVTWQGMWIVYTNGFWCKNVFSTDIQRVFAAKKHELFLHIYRGFSFALAIFTANSHPVCQPVHNVKLQQYWSKSTLCFVCIMNFMGYMYALSWKLLIIGLLSEYFAALLKILYLKKIAAKCFIFLHWLYFFLMGSSRTFVWDKDQILSGEGKRKG